MHVFSKGPNYFTRHICRDLFFDVTEGTCSFRAQGFSSPLHMHGERTMWFQVERPNSCPAAKRSLPLRRSPSLQLSCPDFRISSRHSHNSEILSSVLETKEKPSPDMGKSNCTPSIYLTYSVEINQRRVTSASPRSKTSQKLPTRYAWRLPFQQWKNNRQSTTTTKGTAA